MAWLKATGDIEAHVFATACSRSAGSICSLVASFLSDEMIVILEEPVRRATVSNVLKLNELRIHHVGGESAACMEDIMDIYQQPSDPTRPQWIMDEKTYQLLSESKEPIPMRPGDNAKNGTEYDRNGTAPIITCMRSVLTVPTVFIVSAKK